MSDKQSLLKAISELPENASSTQITDALLNWVGSRGAFADYVRLYRLQLNHAELERFYGEMKKGEFSLEEVIGELENSNAPKRSA
jgi:hypothetical protein